MPSRLVETILADSHWRQLEPAAWSLGSPESPAATIRVAILRRPFRRSSSGLLNGGEWRLQDSGWDRRRIIFSQSSATEPLQFTAGRVPGLSQLGTSYGRTYHIRQSRLMSDLSVTAANGDVLIRHEVDADLDPLSGAFRTTLTPRGLDEPHLEALMLTTLYLKIDAGRGGNV